MLSKIEISHYKCFRHASLELAPFNILIGPNASGKSTFLDSLAFIRDALESDVEKAVRKRASTLQELVWKHEDAEKGFEIALEASLPASLKTNGYDTLRYEVGVGLGKNGSIVVGGEHLWLINSAQRRKQELFPVPLFPFEPPADVEPVLHPARLKKPQGYRLVVRKVADSGNDYFRSEKTDWNMMLRFSPQRLALTGIPEDYDRFPSALWWKRVLLQNVQVLQLNSVLMRRTCPSDAPRVFQPDGSNLPIMVKMLLETDPQRFEWWIRHLQTILEDLAHIEVAERPEDRSYYLLVTYRNGLSVPAWLLSDGTLRLLALTLLAYLPNSEQVFVIEEPENGIHPKAIEAVFKALSSVYNSQVFLATHSPLILALAEPENLLVFAQSPGGVTSVVNGSRHPMLRDWQREPSLETLFAAGVLG